MHILICYFSWETFHPIPSPSHPRPSSPLKNRPKFFLGIDSKRLNNHISAGKPLENETIFAILHLIHMRSRETIDSSCWDKHFKGSLNLPPILQPNLLSIPLHHYQLSAIAWYTFFLSSSFPLSLFLLPSPPLLSSSLPSLSPFLPSLFPFSFLPFSLPSLSPSPPLTSSSLLLPPLPSLPLLSSHY